MADTGGVKVATSRRSAPLQIPYYDWPNIRTVTLTGATQVIDVLGEASHVEVRNPVGNGVVWISGDGQVAAAANANGCFPLYAGQVIWIDLEGNVTVRRRIQVIGTLNEKLILLALKKG